MHRAFAKSRWASRIVLLTIAAVVALPCWLLRPLALPGTLGVVASHVRVGMRSHEAVMLIRASGTDNVDCFFCRGATQDGRPFLGLFSNAFDQLPPDTEIAWAELEIDDDQGRDLVITLGPGGVVSGVRLNATSTLEGWRYAIWNRAGR